MNLKKHEIALRIKQYRTKDLKLNQTEFGKLCNVTKAAVSQWENEITIPERDSLLLLQKSKGISLDWILCHTDQKKYDITEKTTNYNVFEKGPELPTKTTKIQILGNAQLGPEGYWEAIDYPPGQGEGNVDFYTTDKDAYALRVRGDSMAPAIRSGWIVVVEPSAPYMAESLVVVCTTDQQCMVKEYYSKRENEYIFLSINTDYKKTVIAAVNVTKIHTISAIIPPYKYNPW